MDRVPEDWLDPNTSRRLAELVDISLGEFGIETVLAALLLRQSAPGGHPSLTKGGGVTLPSTGAVQDIRTPPLPTRPTGARPVLSLPIRPQTLNEMATAANLTGQITKGIATELMAVSAGATNTLVIGGYPGTVGVFVSPVGIRSTYYDPNITAQVLVDGKPIVLPGNIYAIDGPAEVSLGQFYYVETSIAIIITNQSATDALIFGRVEFLQIASTYFHQVFQPILAGGMADLQAAASAQYQGGR